MKAILLSGVLLLAIGAPAVLYFLSTETALEVQPAPKALAAENRLVISIKNPHGARSVTATVRQGGAQSVASVTEPAN
ncbi:MAG: hypothetical protein HY821_05435, partial [Acidobacteria bacterium]|nr:hypothetical protein [Acidobacteriota bacterium]